MQEKTEFPKAYEPSFYEDGIYATWEASGFFNPDGLPGDRKEAFCIVLPPPNVTGTLHIGHAMMLAIEDAMVRFARLQGKKTLWLPGTDHAAIATQTKVEKLLMEEGMKDPRTELGREKFLERVRAFAAQSHDTIVGQCKKMGASLDWSREAYTLDDARTHAVHTVFTRMYEDGLIYRGYRLVNWCPRCKSTLADDEVEHEEKNTVLYTFRYDKNFPIAISTTRPETKFGDTAVAVHPDDERYTAQVGKEFHATFVEQPLTIKMIADASVDPAFGTGALGVTPSHSHIDADLAYAHHLAFRQVIGEEGKMTDVPSAFLGKDVKEARAAVVAWLRQEGLLEKEEDTTQNLSVCYRCGTAAEPLPKEQWFIGVDRPFAFRASSHAPITGIKDGQQVTLKELMRRVVESGEVNIIPDRFKKTYEHWIEHLRDWCISRQIWFGHQIPVWYRGEEIFVGAEAPQGEGWRQDPDTLDTWFSSGLWTFSTLGWPQKTKDMETYHPTSVLETGYDILFFWIARMVLMTTYALGEIPFHEVYLHGLVRDEEGRKMSKSLGNVIDPLEVIKKYGADAVRLSLVLGTSAGNDLRMSEEKIASFRNFANKLWNIARFIITTSQGSKTNTLLPQTVADRWILSRLSEVTKHVTELYGRHEFSLAGEILRDFTWSDVADWYVEIAKIQRKEGQQDSTDGVLRHLLQTLLTLWHPLMPFVTETLWKQAGFEGLLIVSAWPVQEGLDDQKAKEDFGLLQEVVVAIRHLRALHRVEPGVFVRACLFSSRQEAFLREQEEIIKALARVKELAFGEPDPSQETASQTFAKGCVHLFLEGLVDTKAEEARLQKEIEEVRAYLFSIETKLQNQELRSKAPPHVIKIMEAKQEEAAARLLVLEQQKDSEEQKKK